MSTLLCLSINKTYKLQISSLHELLRQCLWLAAFSSYLNARMWLANIWIILSRALGKKTRKKHSHVRMGWNGWVSHFFTEWSYERPLYKLQRFTWSSEVLCCFSTWTHWVSWGLSDLTGLSVASSVRFPTSASCCPELNIKQNALH